MPGFSLAVKPMRHPRLGIAILVTTCYRQRWSAGAGRPPHKKALADYLGPGMAGKLNDCRTCHVPAEEGADALDSRPHNAFGKRLKAVRGELKKAGKPTGIPRGSTPSPMKTVMATVRQPARAGHRPLSRRGR